MPEQLAKSFDKIDNTLMNMRAGYRPHYFKICKGSADIGLCFVNMDPTAQGEYRAYIRHLTVTKIELFEPVLQ